MVLGYEGVLVRYFDYSKNFGVRSARSHTSWNDETGWTDKKINDGDVVPISIPPFQRKLVWQESDIEYLFTSTGKLLGNITFADQEIDGSGKSELMLIDGLQRFSAITAIIRSLWNNVLSDNPAYPGLQHHFDKLKNQINGFMPIIWQHNHDMLLTNTRLGIQSSYQRLSDEVDSFIVGRLKKPRGLPEFAEQVQRTLFSKMLAIDTYHNFNDMDEIIETFKDVNSTGVQLSDIDLLRASIILQTEKLQWSENDMGDGENRFTLTLQPERDSRYNKKYREYFGLRLYKAFKDNKTNVFPDWTSLNLKSLDTLYDYINKCEESQKDMLDVTEYKFPYLREIFNCGALPFIAFVWFYYKNSYLAHLEEIKNISKKIEVNFREENTDEQITDEKVEQHVDETLEKLKNADDLLSEYEQKLRKPNITESRKNRLQNEQKNIEELKNKFPGYYINLPDFLGGTLNTDDNGLLFLRAAYRRQMNGDIGSTAPIVDKLMKGDITTMDELSTEFNPEIDAGPLQNEPNRTWLTGRLTAKVGTAMGQKFFSAMLLPERDSGTTEFNLLVYGTKAGQWQVDHLIADKKLLVGEGNTEGKKITNMAPLDKDSNGLAQTASCLVKIDSNGNCYSNIVDYHPYSKWLVKNHFDDHKDDEITDGLHPLNDQSCLVHLHPSKIGDERIAKMVELLLPKL
jgi:uncharacterized protein with ParB-like and HNH nuclease domain